MITRLLPTVEPNLPRTSSTYVFHDRPLVTFSHSASSVFTELNIQISGFNLSVFLNL